MGHYKVVFDDLEDAMKRSMFPEIQRLTFSLTFTADSKEHAEFIVNSTPDMSDLGAWHVEEVLHPPEVPHD